MQFAVISLLAARASVPDPTLAKCTTPQSTAFPYPWAAGDECVTYSVDEKVGPAWNAGACPGIPDAAHTGGNWFDAAWNRFSTSDCNLTLALLGPPVVAECHDRGDGSFRRRGACWRYAGGSLGARADGGGTASQGPA